MAYLELRVGTVAARVDTSDAAAMEILTAYERAYQLNSGLGPDVRLQNMLEHLVFHVENVARGQLARDAVDTARRTVQESAGGRWIQPGAGK